MIDNDNDNDDPIPNLPLLRKVLDHIDAHPREWNQRNWAIDLVDDRDNVCGTAYCIAGHAVSLIYGTKRLGDSHSGLSFLVPGGDAGSDWFAAGQKALGLTGNEAVDLFYSSNTRADVQEIAEQIADRAGEQL